MLKNYSFKGQFTRARLPGRISSWVHMRNFRPVSEMILGTSSGAKFEKPSKYGETLKF